MMKSSSPLLGFNHNFKHRGQIYHIQTEDSGIKHPHVITHLFADGGRILKSIKTSYATWVGEPKLTQIVRQMMQEQHKAMIIALRDGAFDPGGSRRVDLPSGPYFANSSSAGYVAEALRASVSGPIESLPSASSLTIEGIDAGRTSVVPDSEPTHSATEPDHIDPQAPAPQGRPPTRASDARPSGSEGGGEEIPPTEPAIGIDYGPRPLGVDLAVLEQAARAAAEGPAFQPEQDLPPPPRNVLGPRPTDGAYARVDRPGRKPPVAGKPETPADTPTNRYALTRPASIFATSRPANEGSIFGDDLLSERSLDEVILSYLAEDLDGEK